MKCCYRYSGGNRDYSGQSYAERSITCRKVLTDPEMHSKLKQSHSENPYYRHYFGVWYQESRDVGNIHYLSYRDNMVLELGMAGEKELQLSISLSLPCNNTGSSCFQDVGSHSSSGWQC